jgi:hypothetical protein
MWKIGAGTPLFVMMCSVVRLGKFRTGWVREGLVGLDKAVSLGQVF